MHENAKFSRHSAPQTFMVYVSNKKRNDVRKMYIFSKIPISPCTKVIIELLYSTGHWIQIISIVFLVLIFEDIKDLGCCL